MRSVVLSLLILPALLQSAVAQPELESGRRGYEVCAGCHGFAGEGEQGVHAPALAGLEDWYLERQIQNFQAGIRGHLEADVNGIRMAVMARAVRNERELEDLIAYIASLPARVGLPATGGDADRGRERYALCAACHGTAAQGNEAVSSPGLVALDGWYLVEQLRLFAQGLRGSHADDVYGRQMLGLAASFADEQARLDLAAYIRTLSPLAAAP